MTTAGGRAAGSAGNGPWLASARASVSALRAALAESHALGTHALNTHDPGAHGLNGHGPNAHGPECRSTRASIHDYLSGRLLPHRRRRLETHLDGCAQCIRAFIDVREVSWLLRARNRRLVAAADRGGRHRRSTEDHGMQRTAHG